MTDEAYIKLMATLHIDIDERTLADARAELRRQADRPCCAGVGGQNATSLTPCSCLPIGRPMETT